MFRDRIFEWSQNLGRITDTWNGVDVFVAARRRLVLSALSLREARIDGRRAEITREVSRAYMPAINGNR